jgi:hypothetical protein
VEEFASGWLTPLMFAAREGHLELARILVAAGADVNAVAGDGKTALAVAIFERQLRGRVVPRGQQGRRQQGRRPAVHAALLGRRPPQHGNGAELSVDGDGRSDAAHPEAARRGANPNATVNNTPRARMREGSPRIVFVSALMRAAFSGDLDLVKLLLEHGADPTVISRDGETMVEAAAGLGFIQGYNRGRSARGNASRW